MILQKPVLSFRCNDFFKMANLNATSSSATLNTRPSEHMHTTKTGCVFVSSLGINHNTNNMGGLWYKYFRRPYWVSRNVLN